MEKAATAGRWTAGAPRKLHQAVGALLALSAAYPAVWAQESGQPPAEILLAQGPTDPALRVQVQTSALPRLESPDSGFQAPRIDVSLFPGARPSGLGALVGMSGITVRQTPQPIGLQSQRPSIDLGLRFSQRVQSQQVDIMAWRRMSSDDDAYALVTSRQPVYGARVEMNLSTAGKSGLAADLGFVGLQMEGGARISIKRKNGGPMVYYRSTF